MRAIVTGANSGMGRATAAALADMGYEVIMLCRDPARGNEAYTSLLQEVPDRRLTLMLCDLGSYSSIRAFAADFRARYETLDVLVNNAGFISLDRQLTAEGVERQFGINHLGHFLLTHLLLPCMAPGSRIVVVASGGHKAGRIHTKDINLTHGYNVVTAYGQSKLANVLFTREMARRLRPRRITVNCCHPGAVATNMGVSRDTGFGKTITGLLKPFFRTPAEGARTAIFLATDPSVRNMTGGYFYDCRPAASSRRSHSKAAAAELYEISARMTGLTAEETI